MKEKNRNIIKYITVMLLGVIMNQGFNILAEALNLPAWLDTGGTAFAAIALEPAAGIVVGFINNFYLSVIYNDMSTIIYFASSAAVALVCGICMRDKQGKVRLKRLWITLLLVLVVTTAISSLLTIIRNGGIPLNNNWENYFYNLAVNNGFPGVISWFFAIGTVKVFDVIGITVIVAAMWLITPKFLKNEVYLEKE